MTEKEFDKWLETAVHTDYIVAIRQKYDFEEEYEYLNVILEGDDGDNFIWSWDWNEGQKDVTILGAIAVEDIPVMELKNTYKFTEGATDDDEERV